MLGGFAPIGKRLICKIASFMRHLLYNKPMKKTIFLTMGGTIDAEAYEQTPVDVTPLAQSLIPSTLRTLGIADNAYEIIPVCSLDSKQVTPNHLKSAIAVMAERDDVDQFIITHGTDTMPDHARLFQSLMEKWNIDPSAKVIFTGAMKPLSNGPETDGWGNLRTSMEKMPELAPGVHIVMHGTVLPIEGARKDLDNARIWVDKTAKDLMPVTPLQK